MTTDPTDIQSGDNHEAHPSGPSQSDPARPGSADPGAPADPGEPIPPGAAASGGDPGGPGRPDWTGPQAPPSLRRPYHGRMLGGVAAGVAEYLGVDVAVVRVGMVLFAFLGGLGVPAYLAGWLFIPEQGAPESLAEEWLGHYQHSAA